MRLRPSSKNFHFSKVNFYWIGAIHLFSILGAIPFFDVRALIPFAVMYSLSTLGITLGFHRLLTHKSFKAPVWFENTFAFLGTLTCQGGPISWVGGHRVHHAYSDTEFDAHDVTKGFWHAHFLWIFNRREDLATVSEVAHYCPDIASRPFMQWLEKHMINIQIVLGLSTFALGYAIDGWRLGVSFIVYGIFIRLMAVYHSTWFVNSACHTFGSNPNNLKDRSRNLWWVGLCAFGEGWHNNHHAQARSARHGWEWYQLDITWLTIKTFELLGVVKDIHYPQKRQTEEVQQTPVTVPLDSASTTV